MTTKETNPDPAYKFSPLKKVLIALDYDPFAQIVAEKGYSLAKSMNAEIILLHVITNPIYYSDQEYSPIMGYGGFNITAFSQMVNSEGLTKASNYFLAETKHHLGDENIKTMVVDNDEKADAIINAALHVHADVIVMGSHGRRWLEQIFLGSVTEKVLHETSIPLFIIPTKNKIDFEL